MTETRPTQFTVTEGDTTLVISARGSSWNVQWSAMNGAEFATLADATTAAERWAIPLERARAMREEATRIERGVIEEMGKVPLVTHS